MTQEERDGARGSGFVSTDPHTEQPTPPASTRPEGGGAARGAPRLTAEAVREALRPIQDPEIAISIIDLGLVRTIDVSPDGTEVKVTMTLTSPMCPEGPLIVEAVDFAVRGLPGVTKADVELQWNPPWDPRKEASDDVKAMLGIWD